MRSTLTAAAALAVMAAALATIAAAGPVAAKQQVAIQQKGGSFVLTPLTSGAITRDTGVATFCCWSQRTIVRDGQTIDVNDPKMTLTGKRGTLVARNRIEWADLPDGMAIFTGSWKVVRGTGAYAGLVGGGLGAGLTPANGPTKALFRGSLTSH